VPRERILRILNHEEPDRIVCTASASPAFWRILKEHAKEPQLATLRELTEGYWLVGPGPSEEFRKMGATFNPFIHYGVGIQVGPDMLEDEWGVRRQLTATKTESRIVFHPLKDADVDSLDDYSFPDPCAAGRFGTSDKEISKLKDNYFIMGGFGFDTFFSQAWYLRGFNQFILDMYSNPEFVNKLLDKLLDYYIRSGRQLVELGVDEIGMADDVAGQTGMILSPSLWRRYIKPRMKKLINAMKPVKYIHYHSDGNLEPIIPDLIEMGVTELNPIQPDCMDPAKVKELYGDQLTLSGCLSVQETLPHGTIEDVKKEVIKTINNCAPGGGFILGPSNLTTQDTPIENFLAIYETAKKYGRYPMASTRFW